MDTLDRDYKFEALKGSVENLCKQVERLDKELVLLRRAVWNGNPYGPLIGGGIMNCDAVAYNKEK